MSQTNTPEELGKQLIELIASGADNAANKKIILQLIADGADVNHVYFTGVSALAYAAWDGDLEVIQALVDKGADVNYLNNESTALIMAAERGHATVVEFLADHGADVNAKEADDTKRSILGVATYHQKPEVVKVLLGKGADIDAQDRDGWTPLIQAVVGNCDDIAQILIDHGANLDIKNYEGLTAMAKALQNNDPKMIKILEDAPERQKQIAAEKEKARQAACVVALPAPMRIPPKLRL